ncbi:MFS transporter [Flindersiella endophytica]
MLTLNTPASRRPDLVATFLRWTFLRAFLHRGWWLVTSVYLVVDAGLSAAQLVTIAVAQGIVSLLFEIPAGVLADTVSRKWSLVVSHALMGTAMLATGLVTDFYLIVATQMLWGLAWTFASGADVAWLTDELGRPDRMPSVLVRVGRAQLTGAAVGIVALGGVAWLLPRWATMVLAGATMLLLGLYVVVRFREVNFVPATSRRWAASWQILVRGTTLVRRGRPLLLVFAATVVAHGALDSGRLYQLRLIDVGFPAEPLVWFTALNVLMLGLGAVTLKLVEARVHHLPVARVGWWSGAGWAVACVAGALGVTVLALTPSPILGAAAVVLVASTVDPMTRTISTIWVNQQSSNEVRATVHSFLAQAEYLGEIACGALIAVVAVAAGVPAALLCAGVLFAVTGLLARRAG